MHKNITDMDKGIAVYCASSDKIAQTYFDAARRLGHAIATAGVPLIDGAGRIGLMGAVNDAASTQADAP